jgi:hypothetical protein
LSVVTRLRKCSSAGPSGGIHPDRDASRNVARVALAAIARFGATPFDWLLFRRAESLGAGIVVVLAIVVVQTDEQSGTLSMRLGRLASVVAVAGGLGAYVAVQQARARGEIVALLSIGVAPARASIGAALGGLLVGLVGPVLVGAGSVDLCPLFPLLPAGGGTFRAVSPDALLEVTRGLLLRASGEIAVAGAAALPEAARVLPRVSTAIALLSAALAVPFWAAQSIRPGQRLVVVLATVLSSVALFHIVAVGRAPAFVLPLAPLLLFWDAARSARW